MILAPRKAKYTAKYSKRIERLLASYFLCILLYLAIGKTLVSHRRQIQLRNTYSSGIPYSKRETWKRASHDVFLANGRRRACDRPFG